MADDEDLRDTLPKPPHASPSRRDAAIEDAMRRFDGLPPTQPARTVPPKRASWLTRPQLGAMVTVGLMAIIGVPAAWLTVERHNSGQPATPPTAASDLASAPSSYVHKLEESSAPARKPARVVTEQAPAPRSVADAEPAGPPIAAEAKPEAKAAAPEPATSQRYASREDTPVVDPPAIVAAPIMAAPAPPAPAGAYPAPPPPPPPPPPPAAAAAAPSARLMAQDREMDDVVVTGARIPRSRPARGEWNACTVSDPKRDLAVCTQWLGTGEPGTTGAAAAHIADGVSRAWSGDLDGAIHAFDAAIAIAPDAPDALIDRSQAYAQRGDYEKALRDADDAVETAPGSARAYYNRSVIQLRRGKAAKAQRDGKRAIKLNPSYSSAFEQ